MQSSDPSGNANSFSDLSGELQPSGFVSWVGTTGLVNLTMVFTDIIGSTRLNARFGDVRWSEIRSAHFARARKVVEERHGYVIKTIGDALMVAFRNSVDAIRFVRHLEAETGHEAVRIRAGVNTGQVEVNQGDTFGNEVTLAARVTDKAKNGGIWVSERVLSDWKSACPKDPLPWKRRPSVVLKGFSKPVTLWSLDPSKVAEAPSVPQPTAETRQCQQAQRCLMDAESALAEGDGAKARNHMWRLRELTVRRQTEHSLIELDQRIRETIFKTDSRPWAGSATDYQRFLAEFPSCLQARLVEYIGAQLRMAAYSRNIHRVVDLCCGTGLLASTLDRLGARIPVIGYDIPEMITLAEQSWNNSAKRNSTGHEFHDIGDLFKCDPLGNAGLFDAAVMSMALFQFGLRERFTLLMPFARFFRSGALFWISDQAPDFMFPDSRLNEDNPFKFELYKAWAQLNYVPDRNQKQAIRPTFRKDTTDNIRHLLGCCGFSLLTTAESLPLIESQRTIDERISFTKMEVISKRVFGKPIPQKWWDRARKKLARYKDSICGTVLLAKKTGPAAPHLFIATPAPPQKTEEVVFSAAAVLRDDKGNILITKRGSIGPLVRNFPNTWSLPSSNARPGKDLATGLKESVQRHLSMELHEISPHAVRISKRADTLCVMVLYTGSWGGEVQLRDRKYTQIKWCRKKEVLDLDGGCGDQGDCLTCLQDVLHSESPKDMAVCSGQVDKNMKEEQL
jgi:class 3 adenylate cyclase/SAM-dependent methyltransferase